MINCFRCRKPTNVYGEGNLGKALTPCIDGHIFLCLPCWLASVAISNGVKEWGVLMSQYQRGTSDVSR